MAKIDLHYRNLINEIISEGVFYEDPNRKGINRLEIPEKSFSYSLKDGFPALTTKKLAWKKVVAETRWILRGQTELKYLHNDNCHIWDKDGFNYYLKNNPKGTLNEFKKGINERNHIAGELGRVYGYQLRNFGGNFDQLQWLINEMRNNPLSTKKDITYLNPNDKDKQALTCCHTGFSIIVYKDLSGFDLKFYMGSSDVFHGLPFNIASYALIGKILEKLTNLEFKNLIPSLTNVHIYEPHLQHIEKQYARDVHKYSKCELEHFDGWKPDMHFNIDSWLSSKTIADFKLVGYESYPSIKEEMLPYSK